MAYASLASLHSFVHREQANGWVRGWCQLVSVGIWKWLNAKMCRSKNIALKLEPLHAPAVVVVVQSTVLGHFLGEGFVSGLQLDVLQRTAPGVPDAPAPTPQFVAHPLGSSRVQLPKEGVVSNDRA